MLAFLRLNSELGDIRQYFVSNKISLKIDLKDENLNMEKSFNMCPKLEDCA